MKLSIIGALTALVLLLAVSSAAAKGQVRVLIGPDPAWPAADETGERPDPYVAFALKNATKGRLYRLVGKDAPESKASNPCNPALGTQWYKAFGDGEVAFPLEPVGSGTYFPFAGQQPCKGRYVMVVHERKAHVRSWRTVRRFAFRYPSFASEYLPLHP